MALEKSREPVLITWRAERDEVAAIGVEEVALLHCEGSLLRTPCREAGKDAGDGTIELEELALSEESLF